MCNEEKKESSMGANAVSIAAGIAGMGLAVASAALMATASQCTVYAAYGARPRTVTYSDYPAFVYLVVANAIAAFLEAIAVFLSVWKKGKDKRARVLMPLLGAAVPALLYSATGAGFAAGNYMSYCSAYGKCISVCSGAGGSNFCSQVHLSVYLSLAAAVAVSIAEVVRSVPLSMSLGGGSDSDSSSSSDSGHCGHGCHSKH
ncbi:CASP-like protein 1U3 [Phragmites australis]|uniref:CASP-like protein 1U3 n=1 Tax=Phragmites australis TaxID=29695 RepID=UPI002D78FC5A|nr:CASP-like protein 1U3 [Phragmites australis]